MSNDNDERKLSKIQENPGLFTGMSRTLRLVLRLMTDSRVSFLLKLLPISTLIYMFMPLDAAIPYIDDAVIFGLGTYFFIELCPPDVVEEHQARIAERVEPHIETDDADVIETTFEEIDQ
jgi:hypothetical protein